MKIDIAIRRCYDDTSISFSGGRNMTKEDQQFLDRINDYANEVLDHIDPQKTQVSYQLQKLRPVMQELAMENGMSVEDVFIKYMDLASEASVERERKFQNTVGNMTQYGDLGDEH